MVLIPTYIVSMKWFPAHKGAAVGLVVTGYGFSTMIMNPIMLAITNPNNVPPAKVDGIEDQGGHSIDNQEGYFFCDSRYLVVVVCLGRMLTFT